MLSGHSLHGMQAVSARSCLGQQDNTRGRPAALTSAPTCSQQSTTVGHAVGMIGCLSCRQRAQQAVGGDRGALQGGLQHQQEPNLPGPSHHGAGGGTEAGPASHPHPLQRLPPHLPASGHDSSAHHTQQHEQNSGFQSEFSGIFQHVIW